ncbi:MAG: hypothetical protein U1F28_07125 [Acinetobacter sp.]
MIEEELEKLEQDNDYQQALAVIENLQQPVLDNVADQFKYLYINFYLILIMLS